MTGRCYWSHGRKYLILADVALGVSGLGHWNQVLDFKRSWVGPKRPAEGVLLPSAVSCPAPRTERLLGSSVHGVRSCKPAYLPHFLSLEQRKRA